MNDLEETYSNVCQQLKTALELLEVPEKWKEADRRIEDAKELLYPICLLTPEANQAWAFLGLIPLMVSPGTGDYSRNLESVRRYLEAAIEAMCDQESL